MAQFADIAHPSGLNTRPTLERVFIWGVAVAIVWQLAILMGFLSFANEESVPGYLVLVAGPWLSLIVAAAAAAAMYVAGGREADPRFHRTWRHGRRWLWIAGVVGMLTLISGGIIDVEGWDEGSGRSERIFRAVDWAFGLLGKSGAILQHLLNTSGLFFTALFAVVGAVLLIIGKIDAISAKPGAIERIFVSNVVAKIAAIPMAIVAVGVFVGATLWTVYHSFTASKLLPDSTLIGFDQYERLWAANNNRWWQAIENLGIYAVITMTLSLTIGFLLAVLLDQKIRFENTFRTILLYPFALSFIVTGLIWQWLLNPDLGFQSVVRSLGWESFTFDPLFNPDIVMFGICIAGLWHGTGLIMCLMLAGLRGIDEEIWKAARVDGIPTWKTYLRIVIPMMRPVFITTIVLIASGILRVYDLVVAQTSGGPGIASDVPARYVYEYMFTAQNLGQGFAASSMMLLAVVIIVIPWAILEFGNRKHG